MSDHAGFPSAQLPDSLSSLSPAPQPKIHLYTAPTPNGFKASMILEELLLAYPDSKELHYDFYNLSFGNNDQKSPQFLKINPNGRIPAMVDDNHGGHAIFETASIMIWLVEVGILILIKIQADAWQNYDKENKFWFSDPLLRSKAHSWVSDPSNNHVQS
jgi:glutathione S-transferase